MMNRNMLMIMKSLAHKNMIPLGRYDIFRKQSST